MKGKVVGPSSFVLQDEDLRFFLPLIPLAIGAAAKYLPGLISKAVEYAPAAISAAKSMFGSSETEQPEYGAEGYGMSYESPVEEYDATAQYEETVYDTTLTDYGEGIVSGELDVATIAVDVNNGRILVDIKSPNVIVPTMLKKIALDYGKILCSKKRGFIKKLGTVVKKAAPFIAGGLIGQQIYKAATAKPKRRAPVAEVATVETPEVVAPTPSEASSQVRTVTKTVYVTPPQPQETQEPEETETPIEESESERSQEEEQEYESRNE